tara:strand:+ start:227 stop:856 length:630 start_codon:yes stop_codon:yes gene_type:complete
MKYYIFGIQRTCTNYAKLLIDNNFFAEYGNKNDYGHWSYKHNGDAEDATSRLAQNTPVIFCYKEPMRWLSSIKDSSMDLVNKYGLSNFPNYTDPQLVISNSECKWSMPKALQVWLTFHVNWIRSAHRCNMIVMNQEKMLEQPNVIDVLTRIQFKQELIKKHPQWQTIDNYVDQGVITNKKISNKNNTLTDYQIDYINNNLPKEINNFFY